MIKHQLAPITKYFTHLPKNEDKSSLSPSAEQAREKKEACRIAEGSDYNSHMTRWQR
jgi:hypothetical protein